MVIVCLVKEEEMNKNTTEYRVLFFQRFITER